MFNPGQVWKYKTRVNEQESTLLILKVEEDGRAKSIIHISISGINIKDTKAGRSIADRIDHIPISQQALANSVIILQRSHSELPDFSEDYAYWKQAYINGKGGVWSIGVDDIIDCTEKTMNGIY